MRKWGALLLPILCMCFLFGCGDKANEDITTIQINKDGSVSGTIVEEFEKEYYEAEDLKEYTLDAIAAYNASGEGKEISVSQVDAEDGIVRLQMKYGSAKDYADFNRRYLFAGTVEEAFEAGENLDVTLVDATDATKTIGKSEILQLGSRNVVMVGEDVAVKVPGKILYLSEGAELKNSKTALLHPNGGNAYLIYK